MNNVNNNANINTVSKFVSDEFNELNVLISDDDTLWFIGSEVAEALGYDRKHTSQAIARFVMPEDIRVLSFKTSAVCEAVRNTLWAGMDFSNKTLISEYGMYSLVMKAQSPDARDFQYWVTHVVLPSIREHGGYIDGQEKLSRNEQKAVFEDIAKLNSKIAFLQKRRHEILADNRALKSQVKQQTKKCDDLDEYARLWEDMYSKLMTDYKSLYKQKTKDAADFTTKENTNFDDDADDTYIVDIMSGLVIPKCFAHFNVE